jgi:hypothetical protein
VPCLQKALRKLNGNVRTISIHRQWRRPGLSTRDTVRPSAKKTSKKVDHTLKHKVTKASLSRLYSSYRDKGSAAVCCLFRSTVLGRAEFGSNARSRRSSPSSSTNLHGLANLSSLLRISTITMTDRPWVGSLLDSVKDQSVRRDRGSLSSSLSSRLRSQVPVPQGSVNDPIPPPLPLRMQGHVPVARQESVIDSKMQPSS